MTTSKGSVRIIGGEHRGRRLGFTDHNGDLRPTGDRLRETLFNWLQFETAGRAVLDLFAGSGALAAEALSRGAASADLVEKKTARAKDLTQQLKPIFATRATVHCADAMDWLARVPVRHFDLVFVDPPYDLHLQARACETLQTRGLLAADALVYVESRRQDAAPVVPPQWQLRREKLAGDVRAQLYEVG